MKNKKTKTFKDEVKKTNQLFIQIKQIGNCDEKGRSVLSVGYNGKFIAAPDKPLCTLVYPIIEEMFGFIKYSNNENAKKDVKAFKELINEINLKKKVNKSGCV